jgi:hypothetical protein
MPKNLGTAQEVSFSADRSTGDPPLPAARVCRSFAQHAATMFFPHLVCDARSRELWALPSLDATQNLGHRSIMSTVRYTALTPNRFKNFWKD